MVCLFLRVRVFVLISEFTCVLALFARMLVCIYGIVE